MRARALPGKTTSNSPPSASATRTGRGIALARLMSFANIAYEGCGNVAVATILTAPHIR